MYVSLHFACLLSTTSIYTPSLIDTQSLSLDKVPQLVSDLFWGQFFYLSSLLADDAMIDFL